MRTLRLQLLIAFGYVLTAKLALLLAIPPGYATAVWPPSGISLAALLLVGIRHFPGVWLGSFVANALNSFDGSSSEAALRSLSLAAGIGAGAALQAVLGAKLVQRSVGPNLSLTREREIFGFYLLGGPVSCLVNATVGTTALVVAGAIPAASVAHTWRTWWVGDTIGVLVCAPLVLIWLGNQQHWRPRRVAVTVPLLLTLAAAVLFFVYASRSERREIEKRFEQDAEHLATRLRHHVEANHEKLYALRGLFTANHDVDRDQFRRYAREALRNHHDILSLEWAPRVLSRDREKLTEELFEHGLAPLGVFEKSAGVVRPRPSMPELVVVQYAEPLSPNAGAVGYDLSSESVRYAALRAARDGDRIAATAPITMVQGDRPMDGFLLVAPCYGELSGKDLSPTARRESLKGYVVAAFRTEQFLQGAMDPAVVPSHIAVRVDDVYDVQSPQEVYEVGETGNAPGRLNLHYETILGVGHRTWRVQLDPTLAYLAHSTGIVAWLVLVGGLVVCALVGAGALILTGRTALVEAVVAKRTEELGVLNQELERRIRAQNRAQEQLQQERTFLRAVLENLNDGIVVVDVHHQTTLSNHAIFSMFERIPAGPNPDSWVGTERLRMADGTTPWCTSALPTVRSLRGEVIREAEVVALPMEAPPRIWSVNSQPLKHADGTTHGAIAVIRDVTEAREAERIKTEFVSTVSHELRTPLTSIRGALGLLVAGVVGKVPSSAQEMLEVALRNSDRLLALINDLLDMEKATAGQMNFELAPEPLLPLIRQSLENNATYASQYKVGLTLIEGDASAWVSVDSRRFLQVMANLLSNAAKFSPADSTVEVSMNANEQYVRVEVRDHGPGIPDSFRAQIFGKFTQADATDARARGGTGLGLAITKTLVEHMGGRIGFDSKAGQGTVFFVEFPRVQAEADAVGAMG